MVRPFGESQPPSRLAPRASSVLCTTARYYLSDSLCAGRKDFFDFAVLPDHADRTKDAI